MANAPLSLSPLPGAACALVVSTLIQACAGGGVSEHPGNGSASENGGSHASAGTSGEGSAGEGGSNPAGGTPGGSENGGSSGTAANGTEDASLDRNVFPSPMPPGNLHPSDAPQIIVFGWDDCMFTGDHQQDTAAAADNGMNFIESVFGNIENPDGSPASVSIYENGAYLPNNEGTWGSETHFTLKAGKDLIALGFEMGNHTFDHLETNGTWGKIPHGFKGSLGGWEESVGTRLDRQTWASPVISFNDQLLKTSYNLSSLFGFRAPRLEINDHGLHALVDEGYLYDVNMEEGNQANYVRAAVQPGADEAGFKWVVWPHTLDHGSPGTWQSQNGGEKLYLKNFPKGLWESPVYMLYVPDDGLQETIATRMRAEITDEPVDEWIGDRVQEITAFDFNTFLYARLTKEEWVKLMKYNFRLRYNGNRAPLTFGAHPAEFSVRYDEEVLKKQPNNRDFIDVLKYNTYQDRKDAVREFVTWVKETYPDDVYFMSNKQLIDYMSNPFDKYGVRVPDDKLALPKVENFLQLAGEFEVHQDKLGSKVNVLATGKGLTFDFTVAEPRGDEYPWVGAATYFSRGVLKNVSHIDITYVAEAPFRVRLPTHDHQNLQVLLAGIGTERMARIRIKDFRPAPYAPVADIAAGSYAGPAYMSKVVGLGFESAAVENGTSFKVEIKKLVFHGIDTGAMNTGASSGAEDVPHWASYREVLPKTSSVYWPAHREPGEEGHARHSR